MGRRGPEQFAFFAGSLRDLIPDDHVLVRVDRVLDLSWLHDVVAKLYCPDNGRPGIAPEAALRLMLAGFLLGIVHDRRLLREADVNLAIRWFAGFGLTEGLPDHSSLTRILQRSGAERFRRIFARTVEACRTAGIAKGEVAHVDATLIRADVAWESLGVRHADAVLAQDPPPEPGPSEAARLLAERDGRQSGRHKKVCLTDPDASMATNARNRRLEPCDKQHTAVDDACGVVLDLEVTTGEANEGDHLVARVDAATALIGHAPTTVTADQGYAYGPRPAAAGRPWRAQTERAALDGLRRARAAGDRPGDPGEEGAAPGQGALAPLPLRRPARPAQMPAGAHAATAAAGRARPVLLLTRGGLPTLPVAR